MMRLVSQRRTSTAPAFAPVFGLPDGAVDAIPSGGWPEIAENARKFLGPPAPLRYAYAPRSRLLFNFAYLHLLGAAWCKASGRACEESEGIPSMDVRIKTTVAFTIAGSSLEDALAEYDELTVSGLIREILDKAIACDNIQVEVVEGPNTLEEYDSQAQGA